MALAEVVSLTATMYSTPVSAVPAAPSSVPFVSLTLTPRRAKASSTAATSERMPLMVKLFQGRDLLSAPAKLQLMAASATCSAPKRDLVMGKHFLFGEVNSDLWLCDKSEFTFHYRIIDAFRQSPRIQKRPAPCNGDAGRLSLSLHAAGSRSSSLAVVWPGATPSVLSRRKSMASVAKSIFRSSTMLGLDMYIKSICSLS